MSLATLEFVIPSWVAYAAAAIVLGARFVGLQAGWSRARTFADPALQGIARRPVREAICLVLLSAGTGAIVGQFATGRPAPMTSAGPVLLVFDTAVPEVPDPGFQQRYAVAQRAGGTAIRLFALERNDTFASMATRGGRSALVASTRDLAGLVSRMTTLVSVADVQSGGRGVPETIRLLQDRYPRSNRVCVLTARRADELIDELRPHATSGVVVVAGAGGMAMDRAYFLLADTRGNFSSTTEEGARSALARSLPVETRGGRAPLPPFQTLALAAYLALALEWALRSSPESGTRRLS